jgi:hypothetical protein
MRRTYRHKMEDLPKHAQHERIEHGERLGRSTTEL